MVFIGLLYQYSEGKTQVQPMTSAKIKQAITVSQQCLCQSFDIYTPKWNAAFIKVITYTCVFPALKCLRIYSQKRLIEIKNEKLFICPLWRI